MKRIAYYTALPLLALGLFAVGALVLGEHALGGLRFQFWQLAAGSVLLIVGILALVMISRRFRREQPLSKRDLIAGKVFVSGCFAIAALGGLSLDWPWWLVVVYGIAAVINAAGAWHDFKRAETPHSGDD